MADRNRAVLLTVLVLLAFMALMAGLFVAQHLHSPRKIDPNQFHGAWLEQPRTIRPFKLTGTDQQLFDEQSLKGQWTLVFFGFTRCGYLCPTTMAELGKAYRLMEEKGAKTLPRVVLISIDPERDSLEKLNDYVKAFDVHFYGARGDEALIQAMAREMGVPYEKVPLKNEQGETYDLQHSGTVILFNPQGEINAFFTSPHQAELLAQDYLLLVS